MFNARLITLACIAGIVVLIPWVYHPVLEHEFLHWDDGAYVNNNPYINHFDIEFVRWALTTTYFSYWHPLTWLSHGLDHALWGMDANRHHLSNLLLYGAVAFAVFAMTVLALRAAWRETSGSRQDHGARCHWAGLVATVLFILHPQHVEVVAWVSERKELLCTFFVIATVHAYLEYGISSKRNWLLASFFMFLLALMAKPMAVTLPAILLVLDHYPLGRVSRNERLRVLVIEKLPFFAASAVVAVITIVVQTDTGAIQNLSLQVRLLNAFNNTVVYAMHWLWPFNLSAFYPFPDYVLDFDYRALFPIGLFLGITAFAIARYRAGGKYWLCVWAIYLITLSPVIGVLHSGPQASADRYAHLTTVGFYVLLAAGVVQAWERVSVKMRTGIVLGLTVLAMTLGWTSYRQSFIWRDDLSLWRSVAERYPGRSAIVHNNLGNAWYSSGNLQEAEAQYFAALSVSDAHADVYSNLYTVLRAQGQHERALQMFTELSQNHPGAALPLEILGQIHEARGKPDVAQTYYQKALVIDPSLASSHYRLAGLYIREGHAEKAAIELAAAIDIAPDYVDAILLLAQLRTARARLDEAVDLYWKAYEVSPTYAPAYRGLIGCLRALGLDSEADHILARVSRLCGYEPL